tara:strand:+ start:4512 stop:4691 length:180 start_codon:yes stop_codon:yes gene_type:complete
MQESLVDILARLESELKELKIKVSTLEKSKTKSVVLDVKKEVESIVTIDYINELYRSVK